MAGAIKTFMFEVQGCGKFPIDMLRYDTCWPRTSTDVGVIQRDRYHVDKETVQLVSLKKPTEGRWNSFGWKVTRVEERK